VVTLASLTKQFTAAAILKLVEQGRLSLDDEITKYLPAYPTRGARITVEHLLTHTSGLSGLNETTDFRATAAPDVNVVDVIGQWYHDLPLEFAPGERWAYSNWGYTLLGAIIEKASGTTYAEFLQQAFFTPLGMTHTFYSDRRRIIAGRVAGYEEPADVPFNIVPSRGRWLHPAAAGGLMSSVEDLARWNAGLDAGRVVRADLLARMFTSYRLKNGTPTNYGYGWDLGDHDGHRVQEHQGGTTGFVSHIVRLPDDRVFVVVLSNRYSMTVPVQTTAHRIAAIA
jgi:CubicO group peptidase (beta-lactamase class C family)